MVTFKSGPKCPKCGAPLNGRTCSECGTNPAEVETVICYSCGDVTVEGDAKEVRSQRPISGQYETRYFCPDCQ